MMCCCSGFGVKWVLDNKMKTVPRTLKLIRNLLVGNLQVNQSRSTRRSITFGGSQNGSCSPIEVDKEFIGWKFASQPEPKY